MGDGTKALAHATSTAWLFCGDIVAVLHSRKSSAAVLRRCRASSTGRAEAAREEDCVEVTASSAVRASSAYTLRRVRGAGGGL